MRQLLFPSLLLSLMLLLGSWPMNPYAQSPTLEIPLQTSEMLRHEKHALLTHHMISENRLEAVLVTRNKVFRHLVQVPGNFGVMLEQFSVASRSIPEDSSDLAKWFDLSHQLFNLLVLPFQTELEDLYQLTIVPDEHMVNIPFEALAIRGNGPLNKRKFMTEIWAISYLPDLVALTPVAERKDPTGIGIIQSSSDVRESGKMVTQDGSGSTLVYRWQGDSPSNELIFEEFMALVDTGAYVDEALGLARMEFLTNIRKQDNQQESLKQHPYYWAAAALYGDISPIHPQKGFPWWIMTIIGFTLILLLGKKL